MKISPKVTKAVQETRNELSPFLENLNFRVLSKYNFGYLKYQNDPTTFFIDLEINRFLYTANYIYKNFPRSTRILDIGLFIPVLPITLTRLGYQVEAIEKLSLYENSLDAIIEYIEIKHKIKIHNVDIITGDISQLINQYDIVLLMAILEHLNGSPKVLLEKCNELLISSGFLFIDVPNISSLPKRISFLVKGKPPLPPYSEYFLSEYPFEGHNREYNTDELEYALTASGFDICKIDYINATLPPNSNLKARIMNALSKYGHKTWREIVWTVSQPNQK